MAPSLELLSSCPHLRGPTRPEDKLSLLSLPWDMHRHQGQSHPRGRVAASGDIFRSRLCIGRVEIKDTAEHLQSPDVPPVTDVGGVEAQRPWC